MTERFIFNCMCAVCVCVEIKVHWIEKVQSRGGEGVESWRHDG